jgi:hypothetical protein
MAKMIDMRVTGLNAVMRALKDFPPEANAELRDEAQRIANNIMAPAYRDAAASVPIWGATLAAGIKAKRDRVPSVNIGYRTPKVSGGANPIMLRWPTDKGMARKSPAPFQRTGWIASAAGYKEAAMEAYGDALTRVVMKWNRGGL